MAVKSLTEFLEEDLGWYMWYFGYLYSWECYCSVYNVEKGDEFVSITYFSRNVNRRIEKYREIILDIVDVLEGIESDAKALEKFKSKYLNKTKYYSEIIIGVLLTLISVIALISGVLGVCTIPVPVFGQIAATTSQVLILGGIVGASFGSGLVTHGLFAIKGKKARLIRDLVDTIEKKDDHLCTMALHRR